MNSWINSPHSVFFVIDGDIASQGIHQINSVLCLEFEGTGSVCVRAIIQCSNWADISKVPTHLWEEHLLNISVDLCSSPSSWSAQIIEATNLFCESDAASAVDASVHVSDHNWANVFILHCSFELVVSAIIIAIVIWVILEIALSSLITDGTIQWMIS